MKYFKPEYQDMNILCDPLKREQVNLLWMKNMAEYTEYFDSIKGLLSPSFLKIYNRHEGLHDAPMLGIEIDTSNKKQCMIVVSLEVNRINYELVYRGVRAYNLKMPSIDEWLGKNMRWGYGEIELLSDGYWNHRVLCEGTCEFDIVCKKISIRQKKLNN
jgi:hypothetical protein